MLMHMKKMSKHTYANIFKCEDEDHYGRYRVEIKTVYDIFIFGKIRHMSTNKVLPFYFSSLEKAKDFCSIMPSYKKVTLKHRGKEGNRLVDEVYKTYQLTLSDGKKFYIIWDHTDNNIDYGLIIDRTIYRKPCEDHTIYKFTSKYNFSYQKGLIESYYDFLSDAIKYYEDPNPQPKEETCYTFELVKK